MTILTERGRFLEDCRSARVSLYIKVKVRPLLFKATICCTDPCSMCRTHQSLGTKVTLIRFNDASASIISEKSLN
jgi:hypothetical protein